MQIQAEIEHLSKVRHPHINKLLAVSFNGPHRCLILEHMNGGALDSRLMNTALPVLEWRDRALVWQRAAVAAEAARGVGCPVRAVRAWRLARGARQARGALREDQSLARAERRLSARELPLIL